MKLKAHFAITVDVKHCARCGGDHSQLVFNAFNTPPEPFTHYAECPTQRQPVLLRIIGENET